MSPGVSDGAGTNRMDIHSNARLPPEVERTWSAPSWTKGSPRPGRPPVQHRCEDGRQPCQPPPRARASKDCVIARHGHALPSQTPLATADGVEIFRAPPRREEGERRPPSKAHRRPLPILWRTLLPRHDQQRRMLSLHGLRQGLSRPQHQARQDQSPHSVSEPSMTRWSVGRPAYAYGSTTSICSAISILGKLSSSRCWARAVGFRPMARAAV